MQLRTPGPNGLNFTAASFGRKNLSPLIKKGFISTKYIFYTALISQECEIASQIMQKCLVKLINCFVHNTVNLDDFWTAQMAILPSPGPFWESIKFFWKMLKFINCANNFYLAPCRK